MFCQSNYVLGTLEIARHALSVLIWSLHRGGLLKRPLTNGETDISGGHPGSKACMYEYTHCKLPNQVSWCHRWGPLMSSSLHWEMCFPFFLSLEYCVAFVVYRGSTSNFYLFLWTWWLMIKTMFLYEKWLQDECQERVLVMKWVEIRQ